MPASGCDPFTPLCGRTLVPFKYVSSFIWTSSATTVSEVTRHHFPTELFQPMILPSIKLKESTFDPESNVEDLIQFPGPTFTFAPMTTSGPIIEEGSTSV